MAIERSPFQSGPIQVQPAGLLGLLQLKSPAGRNPELLEGNVQPTVDLLAQWLNAEARVWLPVSTVTLTSGQNGVRVFTANPVVVPENVWWYVHQFSVYTSGFVGGEVLRNVSPLLITPRVGTRRYHLLTQPLPNDVNVPGIIFGAQGFWVPPGAELGLWVGEITSVPGIQFNADMRYTTLSV